VHLEVVKALLEAGGRELVMLTMYSGAGCRVMSRARVLLLGGKRCWRSGGASW
jgi:hypothetical protein